jgi:hypothetical protein
LPETAGIVVETPRRSGKPWYIGQSAACGGTELVPGVDGDTGVDGDDGDGDDVTGGGGGVLAVPAPPLLVQPARAAAHVMASARRRIRT